MRYYRHTQRNGSRLLKCAVTAAAQLNRRGESTFGSGTAALADMFAVRNIRCSVISADGVRCLWYLPDKAPIDRAIMYLHGGAYAGGRDQMHYCASHLASITGMRVMAVDYRLSGERAYPAALEDSMTVYGWLLSHGGAGERLCIAGDSAGGGLALSTAMMLRDCDMPTPASLALISPWVNLSCTGQSYRLVHDHILRREKILRQAKKYAGRAGIRDKLVSPLYGDHEGLPPTLIIAGTGELLLSDSVRLARSMSGAGVDCELHLYNGMFHDFPMIFPQTRDGREALSLLRRHTHENMRTAKIR